MAAENPHVLVKLTSLAEQAHRPAVEGTFATTDRHERDRRAKFGKHDQAEAEELRPKAKQKSK